MTAPIKPESTGAMPQSRPWEPPPTMPGDAALSLAGVTPLGKPATPLSRSQATGKPVSPFYYKYLTEQLQSIRILAESNGENPEAMEDAFMALELNKPFSMDVTAAELAERDRKPSYLAGVPLAVLNGVTFGVGPEALARVQGVLTGVGARASYDEYLKNYEAWGKQHGLTKVSAELGGSLLVGMAGAPAIATKFNWLKSAAIGAGWGAAAGAGNAQGDDMAGFLRLDDRLMGALTGAATGGAVGGALGAAVQFVGAPLAKAVASTAAGKAVASRLERAARAVTQTELVSVTSEAQARELLVRAMIDAGISYDDAARELTKLAATGVMPNLVSIGGAGVEELVGTAAKQLSPATTVVLQGLKKTLAEQPDVLKAAFLQQAVAPSRLGLANTYDLINALETEASTMAAPFFERSFERVAKVTPKMRAAFLQHPELRAAYNEGAEQVQLDMAARRGHGLPVERLDDAIFGTRRVAAAPAKAASTADDGIDDLLRSAGFSDAQIARTRGPSMQPKPLIIEKSADDAAPLAKPKAPPPEFPDELPVRGIHEMKRRLDAIVERKFAAPDGATPQQLKRVEKLRREYAKSLNVIYDDVVKDVIEQVPEYGNGLVAYRGPSALRDAVLLGEKLWSKTPQRIAKELSNQRLTPAEIDMIRVGYARKAHEVMRTPGVAGRNAAKRFFGGEEFGNPLRAEQIRALFPDNPGGADEFLRFAVGEARVVDATGGVVQNARRLAKEPSGVAEGNIPVRGQLGLSIGSAISNVANRFRTSIPQPVADEIVYLSTKGLTNPAELDALLRELFFTYGGLVRRPTLQRAARRVVGAKVGASTGGVF